MYNCIITSVCTSTLAQCYVCVSVYNVSLQGDMKANTLSMNTTHHF